MQIEFLPPDYLQKVARMLNKEGHECYLVGGAIRDMVSGIEPYDFDLATDATPDEMLKIFPKSVATGARFGMVTALVPNLNGEVFAVEVTTFRSEEQYIDGRWPTEVEFIGEIDKDLGRRDFTINAMAIDMAQHDLMHDMTEPVTWEIYDLFGGIDDITSRIVRAVGTPIERFKEDGLRAFKACRIASQMEFEIEPDTKEAISQAIPVAKMVSMERVRDEFMKMLTKSPKPSVGIELMRETGLLEIFMPELLEGYGVEQKKFHAHDVYWHSLNTCDVAPDDIKLAALLHDVGKPRKDMHNGHFYGHDVEGANMAKEIMQRMKFSKKDIEKVYLLIKNHMFYYPIIEDDMDEATAKNIEEHQWTDTAVRRFISRVGEENVDDLFQLRIADASANPMSSFKPDEIEALESRIAEIREHDMALKIEDLDISGHDLIEAGIEKGPKLGEILNYLLEQVLEDPLNNTQEKLLELAKGYEAGTGS